MADVTVDARPLRTVAGDTPSHFHRSHPLNLGHLRYLTVTTRTGNTGLNVSLMIKPHMVWHDVNLHPWDWLLEIILEAPSIWIEFCRCLNILGKLGDLRLLRIIATFDMLMTAPTSFNFGNSCVGRLGYGPVTKLALHLITLNVSYVAELNWLFRLIAPGSLNRPKDMKMIEKIKIPQSRLTIIPHSRTGTNRLIPRITGRSE